MRPDAAGDAGDVRHFLEAIHARYGYDLRGYAPASMQRRVLAALAKSGLGCVTELEKMSVSDPAFFAEVLESLTVRVSEMFRDPPFYRTLRERVIPLLRTYPRLNIWNSGCASGEEAYSTAILLSEEGLYDRCQIYATDLSPRALEEAKQGVFPSTSLGLFADNYGQAGGTVAFASYYAGVHDRIVLRESLRRNILFFSHDLVGDHTFAEMHLILCRNVLIYFGRDLRQRVLQKLAHSLCPGGFLCLGTSERLAGSGTDLFVEFAMNDQIYRRSSSS